MRHDIRTTIEIEAAPEAVWAELVALEEHSGWNPFIVSASGEVAVGSKLDLRLRPPGGKGMRFRPRVTAVDPARLLEWIGHVGVPGLFAGRHRFELETTATGTRLIHSESFSGVLVRLAKRSLDQGTRAGFELMNEALRERVLARTQRV